VQPTLSMLAGITSDSCNLSTTLHLGRTPLRVHGQHSRPSQEHDEADWNIELVEHGADLRWCGGWNGRHALHHILTNIYYHASRCGDCQGVREGDHTEDYMREGTCSRGD
jgi:hypothetical protein